MRQLTLPFGSLLFVRSPDWQKLRVRVFLKADQLTSHSTVSAKRQLYGNGDGKAVPKPIINAVSTWGLISEAKHKRQSRPAGRLAAAIHDSGSSENEQRE
jgi:hypothetical protein